VTRAFEGKFKEQESSTSAWLAVAASKVPQPRPGSCVEDTRELPDRVLNFIRTHPQMDEHVSNQGDAPVFYKRDVVFSHIVVDRVTTGSFSDKTDYTIFYIGAKTGQIFKVAQWKDSEDGSQKSGLLDVFQATREGESIRAMEISRRLRTLYVTSDSGVRQIQLVMCEARYDSCLQCSRDPGCGWDRESATCRTHRPGLVQDPTGSRAGLCDASVFKRKLIANFGQSVHLSCSVGRSVSTQEAEVEWHHYSKTKGRYTVTFAPEKHVLTNDHGLVVISVSDTDSGRYDCLFNDQLVSSFHIAVDSHRCSAPNKTADYQKIYSDWCNQFEKYKMALKTWEKKKGQCSPVPVIPRIASNEVFDTSRFF
jgi:hypothetical protein